MELLQTNVVGHSANVCFKITLFHHIETNGCYGIDFPPSPYKFSLDSCRCSISPALSCCLLIRDVIFIIYVVDHSRSLLVCAGTACNDHIYLHNRGIHLDGKSKHCRKALILVITTDAGPPTTAAPGVCRIPSYLPHTWVYAIDRASGLSYLAHKYEAVA
jgi:hypothetical protein